MGRTAGPAGGAWCRWDAGSACAGACRWSLRAAALGVAGAWGLGLSVGLLAWGRTVPEGRVLVASVGVAVRVCVGGPLGGAYAGPSIDRSGVPWRGLGSWWACVAAARLLAGWRPCVNAPCGGWGCGAGIPVGRGAGPMCGCAVPGGCSGEVPIPTYLGGLARLRSQQVTPGAPGSLWPRGVVAGVVVLPVPTHALFEGSVARLPSILPERPCCPCGEVTGAWGVKVDGLEDVEAVGPCGAPTPDGARARTFVALVAAVARHRGRRVVMVAVLRQEEEELGCRAPPANILATAALPYVPGRGGETCGCWTRRADGVRL